MHSTIHVFGLVLVAALSGGRAYSQSLSPVFPKAGDRFRVSCTGDLEVTAEGEVGGPYVSRYVEAHRTTQFVHRGLQAVHGVLATNGVSKDGTAIHREVALEGGWLQDESDINAEPAGSNWLLYHHDYVLRRGQRSWVRLPNDPAFYWLDCAFIFAP